MNEIEAAIYFPTIIYTAQRDDYLQSVRNVCYKNLEKIKSDNNELNEVYPVRMTSSLEEDKEISVFSQDILDMSWHILKDQGYAMDNFETFFTEMWCQEHHKYSSMDQHVHAYGAQIVGFYFVDAPENSSKVMFYDPKPGKVQIGLPEEDINNATAASNIINYTPKPGMLIFSNAWLPHSFSKNASSEPFRFVHFNVSIRHKPQSCQPAAEVI